MSRHSEISVPTYRLFHFKWGHIDRADIVAAPDDVEAIRRSADMVAGDTAELWRGASMLKAFNLDPEGRSASGWTDDAVATAS
ncbi:hypothetical protein [Allosphingosinicella deserti]|uniref:Uncharacterized protein n=1 Tax=Allosphingosinicella deserti TaxID=2116704 RepID=A0A2P7QE20_9SPHN|nr:hypothetical protein [Sphingomonas deserti]PSJ36222.1 hypothetical protein C7I55_27255 [Sphingomonas deserti]